MQIILDKDSGAVTAGYIILDVERLRKSMQMISDFIFQKMESNKTQILAII